MLRHFIIVGGSFIVSLSAVFAQEAEEAADSAAGVLPELGKSFQELSFKSIVEGGGIMMYPLALLSLIAMVLIFLYLLTIRRSAVVSDRFMDTADSLLTRRDFNELLNYSRRHSQCIAYITEKSMDFMLRNPGASIEEIREIAGAEGSRQAGLLSGRITYLADIGSIAPMVGLLGTVLGMIKSFLHISQGNFVGVKQMELSSGVSEALVTTAAGLIIGIPALVFYSIFRGRVQKYINELEAATTHLMAMLHAQIRPTRSARQAAATPSYNTPTAHDEQFLHGDRPDLHGI